MEIILLRSVVETFLAAQVVGVPQWGLGVLEIPSVRDVTNVSRHSLLFGRVHEVLL